MRFEPMTDAAGEAADERRARAAHLYFVLGLTQQAVAERMGLNRMKVNRLLAEARERGVVRIQITARNARRLVLEGCLAERFGLSFVAVTPAETAPGAQLSEIVGRYAAQAVQPLLAQARTVAIGWGVTLKALAAATEPAPVPGGAVAPLLGSLSKRSTIDRFEASGILAERLDAECFHMPAPVICDSARSREMIHGQSIVKEVLARAAAADIALMSCGGRRSSTLRAMGFVSEAEMAELSAAGAVGNFLGYFYDGEGRIVDHPINSRVVGLHPDAARRLKVRVMVSGGPDKAAMLGVLLAHGWCTGLVTDEVTATALLA
ncbi:sugar-binding transcriptional regulator [Rubrimonas cliftonensis]|uniref:DNA-binding transcriptional regulator LsrR, DeoR family n=1 Tax=Rubrimonas cliftonensis TaxID=89524 RepID=A0A1H4DIG7_9RHOB|nr:sugar-binding domain-containing protein [Rubrimonas cliftonensis]SEA72387.1 DNA-binding transcriptional regulator LsrR, DeoR family [Rubrimonas cliftonensis]